MTTQKIIRVYPPGYTGGNPLKELEGYLSSGWAVKHITPVKTDSCKGVIHDYIIEKTTRDGEE